MLAAHQAGISMLVPQRIEDLTDMPDNIVPRSDNTWIIWSRYLNTLVEPLRADSKIKVIILRGLISIHITQTYPIGITIILPRSRPALSVIQTVGLLCFVSGAML